MIGMIVSTEYLQQLRGVWDVQLMESDLARTMTGWCWEYFERYSKAPGKEIEGIYYAKLRENKISTARAEEIEQDILPKLNEEYLASEFNLAYLLDETKKYFRDRRLALHAEAIQSLRLGGEVDEAEKLACEYKPLAKGSDADLDLASEEALDRVQMAFENNAVPVVEYPGRLGTFWNSQFVRGGLVAFLAPEKRGKTFLLLDIAMRACTKGYKVAFIQAGDLSEGQLLKRVSVWLAHKSERERYCGQHYQSIADCRYNQWNTCRKRERVCNIGVFEGADVRERKVTLDKLITAYQDYPDYRPCTVCDDYENIGLELGTPWIQMVKAVEPLTIEEAKQNLQDFFVKRKRQFKLSTHANDTLSISQIRAMLSIWEKTDGFVPDVNLVDYADW
jgi:hypothetical protein